MVTSLAIANVFCLLSYGYISQMFSSMRGKQGASPFYKDGNQLKGDR